MHSCIDNYCIYTAHFEPRPYQKFRDTGSDAMEIHNRVLFDFYAGLRLFVWIRNPVHCAMLQGIDLKCASPMIFLGGGRMGGSSSRKIFG